MDGRGRVTFWNPQAERVFGRAREEVMGRAFVDLVLPPELRAEHTREMRRFLESGEAGALNRRVEVSALRRDGTSFPAELAMTPMRVGKAYAFTAFIRDISDRKWAERRLGVQHDVTRALAESPTRDDAAMTVLRTICEGLRWDVGTAWVVDARRPGCCASPCGAPPRRRAWTSARIPRASPARWGGPRSWPGASGLQASPSGWPTWPPTRASVPRRSPCGPASMPPSPSPSCWRATCSGSWSSSAGRSASRRPTSSR